MFINRTHFLVVKMTEPRKILCVEDESDIARIYRIGLASIAQTVICSDGEEALQSLRSDSTIGLVFTDNDMGGHLKSGLYFLEQSRDIAIPKYMVSSPITGEKVPLHDAVRNLGGIGLILKPFGFRFIKTVARETLEQGTSASYEAYARENKFN